MGSDLLTSQPSKMFTLALKHLPTRVLVGENIYLLALWSQCQKWKLRKCLLRGWQLCECYTGYSQALTLNCLFILHNFLQKGNIFCLISARFVFVLHGRFSKTGQSKMYTCSCRWQLLHGPAFETSFLPPPFPHWNGWRQRVTTQSQPPLCKSGNINNKVNIYRWTF